MGCPDWPKCFGSWVPPLSEEQLPENYQETFVNKRLAKNARLSSYLESFGFEALALRVQNDPSIQEEQPFNATKTWIEYINRLIGALIGLLIFGTMIASLVYWRKDRKIFWFSFAAFVLTGIQGWIGSIVVSTNLLHGMINVHLFIAIIIVNLLIYAMYRSHKESLPTKGAVRRRINMVIGVTLLAMVVQIVLGVEVRALVDEIAKGLGYTERSEWIGMLPATFKIHRSFSLLILGLHGFLVWELLRLKHSHIRLWKTGRLLLVVTVAEVITGAIMGYFSIPAFIQPVHLLFATVIMGVQFFVLLLANQKKYIQQTYSAV